MPKIKTNRGAAKRFQKPVLEKFVGIRSTNHILTKENYKSGNVLCVNQLLLKTDLIFPNYYRICESLCFHLAVRLRTVGTISPCRSSYG